MKRLDLALLFLLGLAVALLIARFEVVPGYMDAEYYHATGLQIATGKGWTEPFLWNYLDNPGGLPHPANTYWMPLASFLAAAGMAVSGQPNFWGARLIFILLAAGLPALSAALAYRLTSRRSAGWLAGGLAVFSGFYALYVGLTETFALFMILGTLFLWVATAGGSGLGRSLGLGAIAGLMHLARADGIVWLAAGFFWIGTTVWLRRPGQAWGALVKQWGGLLLAYGLVMAIWYGRNLLVLGSLFPPASSKTLWLVDYDQLYAFPADTLNPQTWLASGWVELLRVRWDAFLANLQTALAVQGAVFLTPLILLGAWRLRRQPIVLLGGLLWLATLLVMTLIFPWAGSRGGFLHSGAAFQPLFWALASEGLLSFIDLGVRWRHWKVERATAGFGWIAVGIAALVTLGVAGSRLAGPEGWSASWDAYQAAGVALERLGVSPSAAVLVNDPPGFYLATQRPALAIPDGDLNALFAAGRRFEAGYLVLEENTVKGLRGLYRQPMDSPGLKYLETVNKIHIFQILAP